MNDKNREYFHQLFENLKILPLKSHFFPLLLFVANNESNSEIHNINTRFISDLHTPTANLKAFQKGPFYFGIQVLNHLPTSIKNTSHNIEQFRSVLKRFLLINSFTHRNILLGTPIEILAQCNHFKSKHLNSFTCNTTQYYSMLLLFI
jgi:hypothetical protein